MISNGGGTRKTVMQSITSGTQTWSGDISGDGSFLKDGAGTTTLSGNNSYQGNTTVLNGILSLTNANDLFDTADVLLTTGGKLDLNYIGTDTIDQLFFDGVSANATGTWGSSASGATHPNDTFFSGTGMLMVSALGSGSSLVNEASVPEPAALSLAMFAIGSALAVRRRRA